MSGPHQKLTTPKKGEPITANGLKNLAAAIVRSIVPGKGIVVQPMGDKVVVSLRPQGRGAGGAGGFQDQAIKKAMYVYFVSLESELPDPTVDDRVERWHMGCVAEEGGGGNTGVWYVINPAGDGWDPLNRW
jgi:hypothetical protein